jgi:hypothetical protein
MERSAGAAQDGHVLAETPQVSGGEMGLLFVLLLIGLIIAAGHVAGVVLGCVWAWWAGRGSRGALVGLAVVGAVEALYLLGALQSVLRGAPVPSLWLPALPAVVQAGLYLAGRRSRSRGP